jgi:hypothetical protein
VIVRFREDPVSAGISVAAILLLAGSLAAMLFLPKPVGPGQVERLKAENKVRAETAAADKRLAEALTYIGAKTWTGTDQQVSPAVLTIATQLAKAHGLNWVALRPQRLDDKTTPPQLPYQAVVEGPFPQVVAYCRDLETQNTKIAVSSVMLSASDAASDNVTANIGLVAYLNSFAPVPAPAPVKKEAKVKPHA